LAFPRLAIGHAHVRDLTAVTAPTLWKLSATVFVRVFFVTVTLTTFLLAILHGGLRDLAVEATPTIDVPFTTPLGFFSGAVALTSPFLANRHRGLDDLSVNAAPTLVWWSAILERFFSSLVALTSALFATPGRNLEHLPLVTAPT
jgi:hypothetical protein